MTIRERLAAAGLRVKARKALCARLRETGMQSADPCDGETIICGCCDLTITRILAALEDDAP